MSENKKTTDNANTTVSNNSDKVITPNVNETDNAITLKYVLEQIEKIQSQTDYLYNAIEAIKNNHTDTVGMGLGNLVEEREKTNRQLISFYEKMYDDLKPKQEINTERIALLNTVIESLSEGMTPCESSEALRDIVSTALQDLTRNL